MGKTTTTMDVSTVVFMWMSISELLPQGGAVKPKVRLIEKTLWDEYVNWKGKAYVYALITEYVKWVWTPLVRQKDMYR